MTTETHPDPSPDPITGAALFFDILTELGVEIIFGHTGGAVIPLHVELNKRMRRGDPCPNSSCAVRRAGPGTPPRVMPGSAAGWGWRWRPRGPGPPT